VFRKVIEEVETQLRHAGAWPTWVLSNHDNARHRTRYDGSLRRCRAAAVLLLTLRGTPFLFQGEELGLQDAVVAPEERVDPGGRDGSRAPIPWQADPPHGWPGAPTWLPFPPDAAHLNVATLRADESSILHLYRRLLRLRRDSRALSLGAFEMLDAPPEMIAYRRRGGSDAVADGDGDGDRGGGRGGDGGAGDDGVGGGGGGGDGGDRLVVVNFAGRARTIDVDGDWVVALDSEGDLGTDAPVTGRLGPEQAVVLRPRPGTP
jgi:alpha-glucosidase